MPQCRMEQMGRNIPVVLPCLAYHPLIDQQGQIFSEVFAACCVSHQMWLALFVKLNGGALQPAPLCQFGCCWLDCGCSLCWQFNTLALPANDLDQGLVFGEQLCCERFQGPIFSDGSRGGDLKNLFGSQFTAFQQAA